MGHDRNNGPETDQPVRLGTFRPGNPGRPPGARNKATLAALALLEGEAEALTRRCVELALAGDTTALRLCLERLLPKGRPVRLQLPMRTLADPRPPARRWYTSSEAPPCRLANEVEDVGPERWGRV